MILKGNNPSTSPVVFLGRENPKQKTRRHTSGRYFNRTPKFGSVWTSSGSDATHPPTRVRRGAGCGLIGLASLGGAKAACAVATPSPARGVHPSHEIYVEEASSRSLLEKSPREGSSCRMSRRQPPCIVAGAFDWNSMPPGASRRASRVASSPRVRVHGPVPSDKGVSVVRHYVPAQDRGTLRTGA